jgi:hypothetical protein
MLLPMQPPGGRGRAARGPASVGAGARSRIARADAGGRAPDRVRAGTPRRNRWGGLGGAAPAGEPPQVTGADRSRRTAPPDRLAGTPPARRYEFIESRNSRLLSVALIFSSRNSIESTGFSGDSTLRSTYMRFSVVSSSSSSSRRVADLLMSIAG